jgi:hypothetical protein
MVFLFLLCFRFTMNPDMWRSEVARNKAVFTDRNSLMRAEELAKFCYGYAPGCRSDAESLILGQVAVAKKRADTAWRKSLAEKLKRTPDFVTYEWVCEHVHTIAPLSRCTALQEPPEQSRDIRLKTDPNIQRTGEHLELLDEPDEALKEEEMEVDPELEDKLLGADSGKSQVETEVSVEFTPISATGTPACPVDPSKTPPRSPRVGKPVSPVKPVVRKESQLDVERPVQNPVQETLERSSGSSKLAGGSEVKVPTVLSTSPSAKREESIEGGEWSTPRPKRLRKKKKKKQPLASPPAPQVSHVMPDRRPSSAERMSGVSYSQAVADGGSYRGPAGGERPGYKPMGRGYPRGYPGAYSGHGRGGYRGGHQGRQGYQPRTTQGPYPRHPAPYQGRYRDHPEATQELRPMGGQALDQGRNRDCPVATPVQASTRESCREPGTSSGFSEDNPGFKSGDARATKTASY